MNYSKFFAGLALLAGTLSFPACSDNDDEPAVKPDPETPTVVTKYNVSLTMTDTDFDLGDGNTIARTFAAGDKAGLYIVKDGAAVVENAVLTYDGESWKSEAQLDDNSGRILVYYPYSATASVNVSATGDADFFAPYINAVGRPGDNQSDLAAAVWPHDVLFGQALQSKSEKEVKEEQLILNVAVSHSLAATSVALPGGTTYTTSDGFAYSTPGAATLTDAKLGSATVTLATVNGRPTFFYLAGKASELSISYSYNGENKAATVKLDGAAGTLTTVDIDGGSPNGGKRDLQIGDLYYRDGSIYPVEELSSLSHAPTGVAGVIFCVDPARFSAEETAFLGKVHALVISAKMARNSKNATYMVWCDAYPKGADDGAGRYNDSKEDSAFPGLFLPLIEDRESYLTSYDVNNADLRGYWYTSVLRNRRSEEIAAGYYQALQAIDNLANSVPVSATATTGWYLPSVGQLLDVMRNLGGAQATTETVQKFLAGEECDFTFTPESAVNLTANLDASIAKIMFTERDPYTTADDAIWTSSYAKAYNSYIYDFVPAVREVIFDNDILSVISYDIIGKGNVRGVLAF